MIFRRHAVMFLATGGLVGRIPIAPGTFGSLIGIPIVYALNELNWRTALIALVLIVLGAVWVAQAAERLLDAKDPGCIVIDEIAGMCVTLLGLPLNLYTVAAGFFLFRLLDVIKPPPIRQIERRLAGGWGVVMDDVAAGAAAHLILWVGLRAVGA
jgi:phosphatidylglycerophosphatase A